MAEIVLGTSNAFALRNWPEPASWVRIISEDIGLEEVQFSFDLLDPMLPEPGRSAMCREVVRAADEHGLSITTAFTGLIVYAQNHLAHPNPLVRDRAREWYVGALEVTTALSAEACGGHIGAMSVADFSDEGRRALIQTCTIDAVRGLTGVAAELGLKYLLWELMPTRREPPHTPEEAIDILEAVNDGARVPVRLCFDVGHCSPTALGRTIDPHEWLERLLPWSPVIHLQQTDGRGDRHWPFSPEYDSVGIIDPGRVVEIAKGSPLERVLLLFEFSHAFDTPDQKIVDDHKWSVDVWSKWL